MNILILTDKNRWFDEEYLTTFVDDLSKQTNQHCNISNSYDHNNISEAYDVCFMLSYSRIVKQGFLDMHAYTIVIHASDLPKGKGMSPLTWQVLEGKNEIVFSLFKATEKLDEGDIFIKKTLKLNGNELVDELREKQVEMPLDLATSFINDHGNLKAVKQEGEGFQYQRRTPLDSQLDINKTISEQFNVLRVCDNENYPAFFYINDEKFVLRITKESNEND